MRVVLLLALVGAAFAAVPESPKRMPQRIVGGSPTTVEQYPYMSNMQYLLGGFWWSQVCGGSLITVRSVLSAAHCYEGDRANEWRVVLGTSSASTGGSVHPVSQLILHAQYNSRTVNNDVAIVVLSTPATLGSSIGLARVPATNYNLADGTTVYAIGWGALSSGGMSSDRLMHVDVNVINQQLCAQRYATLTNWPTITDGMLCAGILDVGGKDACQGDSGGPLAYRAADGHIVVGVTSWGRGCADPHFPGVNARVSHYSNWIVSNAV